MLYENESGELVRVFQAENGEILEEILGISPPSLLSQETLEVIYG